MIAKVHQTEGRKILALCDSNLLGQIFEDGEKILDLSSNFFKGEELSKELLKPILKTFYIINVVGKESIKFLKEEKLISEVSEIKNIPFANIVIMDE